MSAHAVGAAAGTAAGTAAGAVQARPAALADRVLAALDVAGDDHHVPVSYTHLTLPTTERV